MNFSDFLNNQEFINFINELFNKGFSVSIKDEIAWKSVIATSLITAIFTAIVTYFSTSIANKSATKTTLELFDKQEKIKIKNELRINFYNQYKNLFDELSELITELISNLGFWANNIYIDENENFTSTYENINSIESILTLCNYNSFRNCLNIMNNTMNSFDRLKDFMDKNQKITKYNKFKYEEEYRFINNVISKISSINAINILFNENRNENRDLNNERIDHYIVQFRELYILLSNLSDPDSQNSQYEFNNFNEFKKSFFSKNDEITDDFIAHYFEEPKDVKKSKFNFFHCQKNKNS